MIRLIKRNKEIIWNLALNDFATKYAGSIFGTFWAFLQPIMTVLIYACVFQYGLRSTSPVEGVSYLFWFAAGMIPWFFFADCVRAITGVYIEYSYLVKKVVFDIELLPIIKIISSFFVHLVFLVLLFCVGFLCGESMPLQLIQLFYYVFATVLLVYAIGKCTSSLVLFFRDLSQIVNIVLDILLWATPIIWPYKNVVPEAFWWIIKNKSCFLPDRRI